MELYFLIQGIVIGFLIAAPVGPIGILCIRRTLASGRLSGLISGLGAATADGFYGVVAAFGLTIISDILVGQQFWFHLIGGIFLIYLGVKICLSKPAQKNNVVKTGGLFGDYISTFFLTITNPVTILSFAAIFAGLGLGNSNGNYISAVLIVLGVVLGSVLWWVTLSGVVNIFRSKFKTDSLKVVNWISGVAIVLFGIFALISIMKL